MTLRGAIPWALAAFIATASLVGGFSYGKHMEEQGRNWGMRDYHHFCFFVGGILLDEETGHAIICERLTNVRPIEKKSLTSQ
jgi:hypothetical protein